MSKVLIAENDLLLADMLEEDLMHAGYDVCGIARTVEEGVAIGLPSRSGSRASGFAVGSPEVWAPRSPLGWIEGAVWASFMRPATQIRFT
jgi:hypothetical protein